MKKVTGIGVGMMMLSAFVFAPIASQAQINAVVAGEATANLDSEVDTNVDAKIDAGVDANTNVDTSAKAESSADSNSNLKINSSGVAVITAAQVSSESDLETFSANASSKNKAVAKVDINSDNNGESEVKVIYRHKGKFLGFIPVTIKSTVVVEAKADAEAEVRSNLSWWSFLVAGKNYAKADLESRIKSNATIKANARVDASAQAKAQVAEAVIAEVTAHANAQASLNK